MSREIVNVMGMELEQWTHEGCKANFGIGNAWATLYFIETKSEDRGKGNASELLRAAKVFYEANGKKFGGTIALNETMRDIYKRLEIEEYNS
jgi:ribosomal protein S18 acetylase RimI-like enzyme